MQTNLDERLDDLLVPFRRDLRAADRSPRTLDLCSETVDRFAAVVPSTWASGDTVRFDGADHRVTSWTHDRQES